MTTDYATLDAHQKNKSASAMLGLACCAAHAGHKTPTYMLTMQSSVQLVLWNAFCNAKNSANIIKLAALVHFFSHAQCCKIPCLNDDTKILMIHCKKGTMIHL